eukprot:2559606-Pyramimonas_sp.AAC.1
MMHDPGSDDGTESEGEIDYDDVSSESAAAELGNMKIDLKMRGLIAATDACMISFWAAKAGAGGVTQQLAKAPGASNGNYSKHFNRVVGSDSVESENVYFVDVPFFKRGDATRSSQSTA